ncbi:hypothetical protein ACFL2U_01615 [Patescibacteria group bacterium]
MQFPDRDGMTNEQAAANAAAAKELTPGKYYNFNPPVKATAIPTGGPKAWQARKMPFARGWYLGFKDGNHVFQGKPIVRPADIPENLMESYFPVLFIGGVTCTMDENQTPE